MTIPALKQIPQQHQSFSSPSFLSTVENCFDGVEGAMLMEYLHAHSNHSKDPVRSDLLWADYFIDDQYYVPKCEAEVIQSNAKEIARITKGHSSYLDYGPGSDSAIRSKTLPVLKSAQKVSCYMSIDMCQAYVDNSISVIGRHLEGIKVHGVVGDFYQDQSLLCDNKNYVGLFFGCTSGNIAEANNYSNPNNAIRAFGHIRKTLGEGNYLIVTQDTNQDPLQLVSAYDCDTAQKYNMNVLYRIQRDLRPVGFNPEYYEYEGQWHENDKYYAGYAKAKHDHTFFLNNDKINVKHGQRICLYRSYKYSEEKFLSLTQEAGLSHVKTSFDKTNRIALHVLKT